MKAISALCNLQRDRQLKQEPYRKKAVHRGDGSFKEILGKEERKIGSISEDERRKSDSKSGQG